MTEDVVAEVASTADKAVAEVAPRRTRLRPRTHPTLAKDASMADETVAEVMSTADYQMRCTSLSGSLIDISLDLSMWSRCFHGVLLRVSTA